MTLLVFKFNKKVHCRARSVAHSQHVTQIGPPLSTTKGRAVKLCGSSTENPPSIDATNVPERMCLYVNDAVFGNAVMKLKVFNNYPRLCLFASREKCAGEEIRYDYGDEHVPWRQETKVDELDMEVFIGKIRPEANPILPVLNHLQAPLVAELDVTSVNKELKEYIDINVEDQVNQTCNTKIETTVNGALLELKSDMLENFDGKFAGLQHRLTMKFTSMEDRVREGKKELKYNLTTKINELQKITSAQFTSLEDSLREENKELKFNFTTDINHLLEITSAQFTSLENSLREENKILKYNLTIDINHWQEITSAHFTSLENSLREENKILKYNLTTNINHLQEITSVQFTSLEDSLELQYNMTTEINRLQQLTTVQFKNLEDSLKNENEERKHNLTTKINQLNLELRKENEQMKSDLQELKNSMKSLSNLLILGDCTDLIGITSKSGIYLLHQGGSVFFKTYCDMETDGGGWTVFHRRLNGQTDFFRGWNDYKNGFGDPQPEFWMGNSKLALMTSQRQYELRINLEDFSGETAYAKYSTFSIGDESTKYKLTISGYRGTAGDTLKTHNNQEFSAKDSDNSCVARRENTFFGEIVTNCANVLKGAWWYSSCYYCFSMLTDCIWAATNDP